MPAQSRLQDLGGLDIRNTGALELPTRMTLPVSVAPRLSGYASITAMQPLSNAQYLGGYLRGCVETGTTVREGLHRQRCPQLTEFAATECPHAAHGEGPAGAHDV